MQLALQGGGTGTHAVTTTAVYYPITTPVLALGTVEVGALLELPVGSSVNLCVELAYRFFGTDDSQSAGSWNDVSGTQQGAGKSFKSGSVASVTGMRVQLGLKMYMSSGSGTGRAHMRYPTIVTT
jgi:hypothetical protein